MKCPHCTVEIHAEWQLTSNMDGDVDYQRYMVRSCDCPACERTILSLTKVTRTGPNKDSLIHPAGATRPVAREVPTPYSTDYSEAVAVLSISPKASAALSRRNLQAILRDQIKVKHSDLSKEIGEFIKMPSTPTSLAEVVDAVRNIGNLAAHPIKDASTGLLVEVEAGEAEWLLDVLDALFDYCFVQPARNAARTKALNAKLASAGKPPMK